MIYLDTHVVVWLFADKDMLSKNARRLIEESHSIFISPMVLLELDFLYEIQRITLDSQSVYDYLHDQIGLSLCEKSFSAAVQTASKQSWTRDPFDRLITSHAALDENILLTRDEIIRRNYPFAKW